MKKFIVQSCCLIPVEGQDEPQKIIKSSVVIEADNADNALFISKTMSLRDRKLNDWDPTAGPVLVADECPSEDKNAANATKDNGNTSKEQDKKQLQNLALKPERVQPKKSETGKPSKEVPKAEKAKPVKVSKAVKAKGEKAIKEAIKK